MANSIYSNPLLVSRDGDLVDSFERLGLTGRGVGVSELDEAWLQQLLFNNPSALPVEEIDLAYRPLVPVCMELPTAAGPADILFMTPQGRIALVETKLWRNPDARRRVVAQILDYARELAGWSYEDLQREVRRTTGRHGETLYQLVCAGGESVDEAMFVDETTRSLRHGRFLLLIAGDGIREGAGAITTFLDEHGSLEFTFGLVEMAVYQTGNGDRLVQPRVAARSTILKRTVVRIEDHRAVLETAPEEEAAQEADDEAAARQELFRAFWTEFVNGLELDDAGQSLPNVTKSQNVYLLFPPAITEAWISAFVAPSSKSVGVYLAVGRGTGGQTAYEELLREREAIDREIGATVEWLLRNGRPRARLILRPIDITDPGDRQRALEWLRTYTNRFVNAFRPRLERISESLDDT